MSSRIEGPDVTVELRDSVLVLRLNRPARGNSMHGSFFRELIHALEAADGRGNVGAIVTTGVGRTYCVGGDREALTELVARGRVDLAQLGPEGVGGDMDLAMSTIQNRGDHLGSGHWVLRFLEVGTPLIAAINGGVAGGGLALALLHDIRIASRTAKFAPNFVDLGLGPELGISWMLTRLVGVNRAFDVLTRAKPIEADEALDIGLIDQLVEPDELIDAALARAAEFASLPPVAVRMAKRLLRQAEQSTLADQLEREWNSMVRLFADPDTSERLTRFLGSARHHQGDGQQQG
jgi:2-(1,2-epoxy-1,2-dihydrophenyl)acetyl-CoA isomerase